MAESIEVCLTVVEPVTNDSPICESLAVHQSRECWVGKTGNYSALAALTWYWDTQAVASVIDGLNGHGQRVVHELMEANRLSTTGRLRKCACWIEQRRPIRKTEAPNVPSPISCDGSTANLKKGGSMANTRARLEGGTREARGERRKCDEWLSSDPNVDRLQRSETGESSAKRLTGVVPSEVMWHELVTERRFELSSRSSL